MEGVIKGEGGKEGPRAGPQLRRLKRDSPSGVGGARAKAVGSSAGTRAGRVEGTEDGCQTKGRLSGGGTE